MTRFLLLLAVLTVLFGCDGRTRPPREALTGYLDAVLAERHEDAYPYLSIADRDLISLLVFHYEVHKVACVSKAVRLAHTTFRVKKLRLGPEVGRATATVVLIVPKRGMVEKAIAAEREAALRDARRNLAGAEGGAAPAGAGKTLEEEADRLVIEALRTLEYRRVLDTEKVETTFDLVREAEGWKVHLGWDGREPVTLPLLLGRASLEF